MHRFVNIDAERHWWNHLTNAETGRTLDLGPGESAMVDLPLDFEDAVLCLHPSEVVKAPRPRVTKVRGKQSPASPSEPPVAVTEAPEAAPEAEVPEPTTEAEAPAEDTKE